MPVTPALRGRDRRIPGAHGLSLLVSSRLVKDPVKKRGKWSLAMILGLSSISSHAPTHACVHTQRQIDLMDIKIWFPFLASP